MKRKGLTIGLLLIVASIWGAVLSRFWRPKSTEPETSVGALMPMDDDHTVIDTLPPTASLGNYRDPFLQVMPTRPVPTSAVPRAKIPTAAKEKRKQENQPTEIWPRIAYNGLLRNNANSRAVALLNVDGHDAMFVQGVEDQRGLKVVKASSDSVLVALHDEVRSFRR
jgi:hypothetical protein